MREIIIELADNQGITISIDNMSKEQLLNADEIFLSNSLIGLWPVIRLQGQNICVGETSRKLQRLINRDIPLIHV